MAYGNPAASLFVRDFMQGLAKMKKREREPVKTVPMSLAMLTNLHSYLDSCDAATMTFRLWFKATSSLCFYGMCRIGEVLGLRHRDVTLGLQRPSEDSGAIVTYGAYVIKDLKTDHDPTAHRDYHLHLLPRVQRACEALTHIGAWIEHTTGTLQHKWDRNELLFPMLKGITGLKGEGDVADFSDVSVKWQDDMSPATLGAVLRVLGNRSGMLDAVYGNHFKLSAHCFRRGGAQHRFMFAAPESRMNLKETKWWAGWAVGESAEVVVKYLVGDALDREDIEMSDMLAPDKRQQRRGHVQVHAPAGTSASSITSRLDDIMSELQGLKEKICSEARLVDNSPAPAEAAATSDSTQSQTSLVSVLPEAKTWHDYVTQYWNADEARHQYRAGVDFTPDKRRENKSRIYRMRLIAEYVRDHFDGDIDRADVFLSAHLPKKPTVNTVVDYIRSVKKKSAR